MLAKDVAERKIDISSKEYSRRITEIAELSQERTIKETMNNHWISYKVVDWTQGVPSINYGPDTAEVLSRNLQKDWKYARDRDRWGVLLPGEQTASSVTGTTTYCSLILD
eukprot:GHVU01034145.1.p1 GENE.GHVU01034145.1~~GHVU01034145.1.p1  ORF type:complete len:110 (-),score=13.14 GHVU01034145.1:365-694(-)